MNIKQDQQKISVYLHWPFCLSKCPYCDFNSHTFTTIEQDRWQDAYLQELEYFAHILKGKSIGSIFFGGGTPSLMEPKLIEAILNKIATLGNITKNTEITIEANPTSSESGKFLGFKSAGVNRISLGIQSFNEQDLRFLGRKHSKQEAIDAIKLAAKHFTNYSFDLIYARPNQEISAWRKELQLAIDLASKHISLYQLTIEKGTPFYSMYHKGQFDLPDQDKAFDFYEATNLFLQQHGYERYEISNYGQKGFASVHNLNYWQYGQYLGIGPGAHSRLVTQENTMQAMEMIYSPQNWLASVSANNCGIKSTTLLTKLEVTKEIIMMGLRLTQGMNNEQLIKLTGKTFADLLPADLLEALIQSDLLSISSTGQMLTTKGLAVHSRIISKIFDNLLYSQLI